MQDKQPPKKSRFESLYRPAQKYITLNDGDSELIPITLRLPSPPDIRYIDGYGLAPEEQKFNYPDEPPRLKILASNCLGKPISGRKPEGNMIGYSQLKTFWNALNDEQESYKEEIDYIRRTIWYLYYGYWCFIFGRPTWIPPKHFFYLKFYYAKAVQKNRIIYREEDRLVKLFEHYCDTTRETFKNLDEKGNAVPDEFGRYEMIDAGHRTCLGSIQPKRRRKGVSMQNCSDAIYTLITGRERKCIIQADTGKSGEDIYHDSALSAWVNLPIWLKPIYDGDQDPKIIKLRPPASVVGERYLDGELFANDAAKEGVNDRRKIHFLLNDESAKVSLYDVEKRYEIDRLTLLQGTDVHGTSRNPSTVEEMGRGGSEYQKLFARSNFYNRDLNGFTSTGLFRLFRPVWQGWDGYFDEWGFSVTSIPSEAQLKNPPYASDFPMNGMGSKDYWQKKYSDMLADPSSHGRYRLEIRKHPMRSSDSWIGSAGDMAFPYVMMDQRIAELRLKSDTITGNFVRRGDATEWVPCDNGRFIVSNLFIGQQNQWTFGQDIWDEKKQSNVPAKRPRYTTKFTCGADPFTYGGAEGGKKAEFRVSDGGIAILWNQDPEERDMKEMKSYKLICTYKNRPSSLEAYCEDVLAVCLYYGAMLCFERNKERLWEYFVDNGYGGYLLYLADPSGVIKDKPGVYAQTASKDALFQCIRDYLEFRCHVEDHIEFLSDAREIRDPRQLSRFDRLAAVGWSLYGSKNSNYAMAIQRIDGDMDLSEWYEGEKDY